MGYCNKKVGGERPGKARVKMNGAWVEYHGVAKGARQGRFVRVLSVLAKTWRGRKGPKIMTIFKLCGTPVCPYLNVRLFPCCTQVALIIERATSRVAAL